MSDLIGTVTSSWYAIPLGSLLIGMTFGFCPRLMLRLIVKLYPASDERREELLGELRSVNRAMRVLWVCEQLEPALFDGLPRKIKQAWQGRPSGLEGKWLSRLPWLVNTVWGWLVTVVGFVFRLLTMLIIAVKRATEHRKTDVVEGHLDAQLPMPVASLRGTIGPIQLSYKHDGAFYTETITPKGRVVRIEDETGEVLEISEVRSTSGETPRSQQ
jgi:hypothetical protein